MNWPHTASTGTPCTGWTIEHRGSYFGLFKTRVEATHEAWAMYGKAGKFRIVQYV